MNGLPFQFLAEVDPQDIMNSMRNLDPSVRERLIVVGSITLITLFIAIWVVFFRGGGGKSRSRRHRRRQEHSEKPAPIVTDAPKEAEDGERRHRRRRREHRPRNPTLAETGGLPPKRPNSPPDSDI